MGQSLGGRAHRRVGIIQQCPETENSRLQNELEPETISKQSFESELNALWNELEQERITGLETEINALRNELEQKRIAEQSLEPEINRLRNELIEVGIAKQNSETETNRLRNELEQERISGQSLETEMNGLRNELEQKRIAEQSLETAINRLRNELEEERIAKQGSETEISRLQNELEQERIGGQSLETEMNGLRNELEQKRIAEQSLETAINRLRNELEEERIAKQGSETEISRLRNELEQERIGGQSLETEMNGLRNELEQEKIRFDELQNQIENEWVINSSDIHMPEDGKLGEGAWGIVYSGKFLDCDVAVKQIHEAIDIESRRLFLREIKMASKCRHPCLLLFTGAIMEEKTLLVTELMECSLRSKLFPDRGEETLEKDDESFISLDVALALHYLHEKKPDPILHNDVSSANVLLWRSATHWRAKLSDYGTANIVRRSNLNYAGAAVYCAPEFTDTVNADAVISCKVF
ncbi:uncharacterized protein LOC141881866 isoform X2 [Acropora palmata]|uniref:uncharacterized protein LOC141881866 isoform X2 n=1 Tax=Acropora palmata TaxID=6131 RepID=UPI003DA1086E